MPLAYRMPAAAAASGQAALVHLRPEYRDMGEDGFRRAQPILQNYATPPMSSRPARRFAKNAGTVRPARRSAAMKVNGQVQKILANYESDCPGTKANLARILMHGKLGGTGKLVILPVDQG